MVSGICLLISCCISCLFLKVCMLWLMCLILSRLRVFYMYLGGFFLLVWVMVRKFLLWVWLKICWNLFGGCFIFELLRLMVMKVLWNGSVWLRVFCVCFLLRWWRKLRISLWWMFSSFLLFCSVVWMLVSIILKGML